MLRLSSSAATKCRRSTVYPVIDSPDGLTFFANLGAITFHVPTVTTDRGEQPDWVVWDLDPPPGRTGLVRQAAEKMRALLDVLAVPTLLMASGSNGYHLRCRLDGSAGADAVARLARGTAELAASMHSELMTVESRKTRRAGRVFVDWLRNTPHATTVAPWSLRPRRGAPVACPIPWEDLWSVAPDGIYLGDVARLSNPWRDYDRLARSMRYIEIDADRWATEIREATEEVVARNLEEIGSVGDVWVIQIITRGPLEVAGETAFGLEDENEPLSKPTIVVIVRPINFREFGLLYEEGVSLGVSLLNRSMTGPLDPRVKSTARLAFSRAERKAARMTGAHARGAKAWTVLFHDDGTFAEASRANLCAVAGDRIVRPPRHYALEGISLETLCELREAQGLTVEERPLSLYDLVNADEVMITSTSFCASRGEHRRNLFAGWRQRLPQDARAVAGVGAVRFRATSRRDRPRGVSPQGPCDPGSDRTTCRCITRRERRRRDIVWGIVSQRVPPVRNPPA